MCARKYERKYDKDAFKHTCMYMHMHMSTSKVVQVVCKLKNERFGQKVNA